MEKSQHRLENILQSWKKLLRQNRKSIFEQKSPLSPQINVVLQSLRLFVETILMTWTFLILMQKICWNNFWRYSHIWGSLKTIKPLFCLLFGKTHGNLQKYHILMMNRALMPTNHFYTLEFIEFKWYSRSKCIPIPLNNLVWYFQKIPITYNFEQNCWDKIENLFLSKKTPSTSKSMLFAKS